MFDPAISHSQEPSETALQRGLGTNLTMYGWMDKPENIEYFKKFQNGMKATANYSDDELISKGKPHAVFRVDNINSAPRFRLERTT